MVIIHKNFETVSYINSSLLKITIHSLIHLIFLKRVNHLLWLKYRIVKKTEMLPNILLRNLRHLPINAIELQ